MRNEDRAIRLIAGALLASDLEPHQLLKIAERLTYDRRWTELLACVIRGLAHTPSEVGERGRYQKSAVESDAVSDLIEEINSLFKRKRLPKIEALSILRKASKSKRWRPNPNTTLRENAAALVAVLEDAEEGKRLLEDVARFLGDGGDPYLRELS